MPIYEYVCLNCGEKFEAMRLMKDADAPIPCRHCESEHITRKLSVFFASRGGRTVAGTASGCAGCSGGSCATCRH